jgi:hypothetical protein
MSSVLPLLTLRPHDGSADVPLTSEVVLIGRDASRCDVHAHGDPYLSRVHFELRRCSATSTVTVLLRGKRRSWLNGFILPNDVPVEVTRDADNEKYQPPGCESDDPILFVSVPNRDSVAFNPSGLREGFTGYSLCGLPRAPPSATAAPATLDVVIPQGCVADRQFRMAAPDGTLLAYVVPPGYGPGMEIRVALPPRLSARQVKGAGPAVQPSLPRQAEKRTGSAAEWTDLPASVRPRRTTAPPPEPAAAADAAAGAAVVPVPVLATVSAVVPVPVTVKAPAAVLAAVPAGIFSGFKFLIGRKGEYRVGGKLYDNAARLARFHGAILVDSVHDATCLIIDRAVEPEAAVRALSTLER